jgi:MtaA/CmuA family methyltransferase
VTVQESADMTSKERCLNAIAGKPVDRVPVFPLLMFFAVDRAKITYRQYATDAAALTDAQLNMRYRFGVDAITVCSDAFRLSADLGGEMDYPEMAPPRLVRPLVRSEADLKRLPRPEPTAKGSRMADRVEGVRGVAKAVGDECLLLGWIDLPFAEACAICGISDFMMMLLDAPALAHRVLEFLTPLVIDFAIAQVEAGSPMVGAGDAAASLISPQMYREFVLPYEQRVCAAVRDRGGTIKLHICGNTNRLLEDMARCGADLFNVDHMVDLARAADVYAKAGKCFKGNLNPVAEMLQSTPQRCRDRAIECIRIAAGRPYMLSAGCEVPAGVTDETFRAFCEAPLS